MRTKRIRIKKGQRAEVQVRNANAPTCDGRNTRGYINFVLIGPCSISVVVGRKL